MPLGEGQNQPFQAFGAPGLDSRHTITPCLHEPGSNCVALIAAFTCGAWCCTATGAAANAATALLMLPALENAADVATISAAVS